MSAFAANVMPGGICFFVGVIVGAIAVVWVRLLADKRQSNPQAKPRIVQHGVSMLREHAGPTTISPRTGRISCGSCRGVEGEDRVLMSCPCLKREIDLSPETKAEFDATAAEYKPALDVLARKDGNQVAEFAKWQRNLRRAGKSHD